ncbi:protein yellow-like [Bacillus rossius redtenbacheri]|uniref:protein yellow-like n=1 Tax=Bacillus rossius redtenbacheri TaxID=93214 RepID=UPI002FDED0B9
MKQAAASVLLLAAVCRAQLEVVSQWPFLQFDVPADFPKGSYVPENNVFTGLEVGWGRVFLSLPRLRTGVAATVATISRSDLRGQLGSAPTLQAYPSWTWHRAEANCSGLISVYRVRADRCDRLWVLDSGVMTSLEDYRPVCPPKLLAFDMRTDRLLRSYEFPRSTLRPHSLLTNLVIDPQSGGSCDNAFIYISDTASPGILVYDMQRDQTWRVSHTTMWPSPDHATYTVGGESFTLPDGIIGMGLSPAPLAHPTQQVLYFQPLASDRIFSVPVSALRTRPDPSAVENSLPVSLVGYKSSQSAALAVDPSDGSVVLSPLADYAVTSWDPVTNANHVLALDPAQLQFCSDVRFAERDSGHVWLISSRLQKLFRRTYRAGEVNFRVMRIRVGAVPYNNSLLLV